MGKHESHDSLTTVLGDQDSIFHFLTLLSTKVRQQKVYYYPYLSSLFPLSTDVLGQSPCNLISNTILVTDLHWPFANYPANEGMNNIAPFDFSYSTSTDMIETYLLESFTLYSQVFSENHQNPLYISSYVASPCAFLSLCIFHSSGIAL